MADIHIADHLILPFGKAKKSDLQRIILSSVSANGIYLRADIPFVYINRSKKTALRLHDADDVFPDAKGFPTGNGTLDGWLDFFQKLLIEHMPDATRYELAFLGHYFDLLKMWAGRIDHWQKVFNALLPIPQMQVYVHDPLSNAWSFEPKNNFRVDFGFWTGEKLVAVEIDGAEPEGYARDVRRDRMLRRAEIDVVHILNMEIERHKGQALWALLPKALTEKWKSQPPLSSPAFIPF